MEIGCCFAMLCLSKYVEVSWLSQDVFCSTWVPVSRRSKHSKSRQLWARLVGCCNVQSCPVLTKQEGASVRYHAIWNMICFTLGLNKTYSLDIFACMRLWVSRRTRAVWNWTWTLPGASQSHCTTSASSGATYWNQHRVPLCRKWVLSFLLLDHLQHHHAEAAGWKNDESIELDLGI